MTFSSVFGIDYGSVLKIGKLDVNFIEDPKLSVNAVENKFGNSCSFPPHLKSINLVT